MISPEQICVLWKLGIRADLYPFRTPSLHGMKKNAFSRFDASSVRWTLCRVYFFECFGQSSRRSVATQSMMVQAVTILNQTIRKTTFVENCEIFSDL